jgi:hypothetical protein
MGVTMLWRSVCQLTNAAAIIFLTLSFAQADPIIIDSTSLPETQLVVAPELSNAMPRRSTWRLHCRTLVPPPIYCFRKRNRLSDCCPRGGASSSAGAGGFPQNDLLALGFHPNVGSSDNGGVGSGGGPGAGPSALFAPTGHSEIPPLAHAPGPIAGAGLPGLIMVCGGLFAWWRGKRMSDRRGSRGLL